MLIMFKKLLLFLGFKKTTVLISEHIPQRQICFELLTALRSGQFKNYNISKGLATLVTTQYASIDTYTQRLHTVTKLLKHEKTLTHEWGSVDGITISLDRFMISHDGCYLNAYEAVSNFKEAGLQLCIALEKSDGASAGLYEHQLRMLTKLLVNLRTITSKLIEVINSK